jgi:hypothetical protein
VGAGVNAVTYPTADTSPGAGRVPTGQAG